MGGAVLMVMGVAVEAVYDGQEDGYPSSINDGQGYPGPLFAGVWGGGVVVLVSGMA